MTWLNYNSIVNYFIQFTEYNIVWVLTFVQIHNFIFNLYLLLSNKIKKNYPLIQNENFNTYLDKFRDYLIFAMVEQLLIVNSLKNITCYFKFDKNFTKFAIGIIYGIFRAGCLNYGDLIGMLIQITFSFGILMIYIDENQLNSLHINMLSNCVYCLMYWFTYLSVNPSYTNTNSDNFKNK